MRLRLSAGLAGSKNFQKTRFFFCTLCIKVKDGGTESAMLITKSNFQNCSHGSHRLSARWQCGAAAPSATRAAAASPGTRSRHSGGTLLFCATCLQASQTQQQKLTPPCGVGYYKERKISLAILTMQLCNCWFQVHTMYYIGRLQENCLPGQCLGYQLCYRDVWEQKTRFL